MSKIVKVEYQGDIRRLPKEAPTWPFSALLSSVRSTYGLTSSSSSSDTLTADSVPFLLKYVDPEGDEVTLASDDDYAEAVQTTASLPSLRLKVYLKPAVAITAAATAPASTAQTPVSAPTSTPTLLFAGSLFQAGTNSSNSNSANASNGDVRAAVPVASDSSSLNRSTSATSSSPSSSTSAGPAPGSAANASAAAPSSSFDEATASTQLRNGALAWLRQNEAQLVTALQTWLANPTIRAELVQAALALLDQVSSRVLDVHAMIASVKAALPSLRTHALIVSFEQHVLTAHRAVLAHYLSLVQPMLVFVDSAVFTNLRAPLASRLTEKLASVRAVQVGPTVRKIIDRLQARVDRAQTRGPHGHHGPHGHGGFGGLFGGHGHGHDHGHGHGHGGGLFGGFGPSPLRMLPLLLSWIRDLDNPSCGNSCSSTSSSSPSSSSSSSSTSSPGSTTGSIPGTASTTATSGIFSANSDDVPNIHYHVQCDGCGMRPLIGFRYKCTHCVNYDLCTACEAKGEHDPSHPFIKIHASSRVHAPWMGRNMMPPPWAPHARRPHTLDPFGPTDPFSGLHAAFAHHHAHPHGGHGHGHPHGHGGHPHGHGGHPHVHGGHPHGHHHGPFGGHLHGRHGHHGHHGHRHGSPDGLHVDLSCSSSSSSSSSSPVSSSPPSSSSTSPALNAAIVEHVTVLEGATLEAGATVVKTWRVMNTGSHAWPANVRLIFERGDRVLSAEEEYSVVAAAPAQTVEVSAVLTAPQQSGRHAAYFRLADDDRMPFGPQFAVIVDVVGEGVAGASTSSSSSSSSSSSASAEHPSSSQQQQQQPSSSSSSQPQQTAFNSRFPTQHQALREMMFFDDARNERVLELAEGELDRAVALLLDQ